MERWLLTQKKLDVGGSAGMVKIRPDTIATFPVEIRRQGWTSRALFSVWICSYKATKPTVTATMTITTAAGGSITFAISGTDSQHAVDAIEYAAVLPIGAGDRTDETSLTTALITIETSNEDASDLYVYGRTAHQLPYQAPTMELAP
jgi:hypothetical protein